MEIFISRFFFFLSLLCSRQVHSLELCGSKILFSRWNYCDPWHLWNFLSSFLRFVSNYAVRFVDGVPMIGVQFMQICYERWAAICANCGRMRGLLISSRIEELWNLNGGMAGSWRREISFGLFVVDTWFSMFFSWTPSELILRTN